MFSAFLTPTIAMIAVYIAYKQYQTAHLKKEQDLFEKRYSVYIVVQNFIEAMLLNPKKLSYATERNLLAPQIPQSYFLFGDDIREYLYVLNRKSCELEACNIVIGDVSSSPNYDQNLSEHSALFAFFKDQFYLTDGASNIEQKFEKYLKVSQGFIKKCPSKRRKKIHDFLAKQKPFISDDNYNHKKATDALWEISADSSSPQGQNK